MPQGAVTPEALASVLRACLAAVGCRVPVEVDGDMVVARDVLVTVGPAGFAGETVDGDSFRPLFSMPPEALQSAACAAAMAVLGPVVAAAAERAAP